MSEKDYSGNVATARRLIDKYGRVVTFYGDSATAADNTDISQGKAAPVELGSAKAAFVYPSGYIRLGQGFAIQSVMDMYSAIMLIAPNEAFDVAAAIQIDDRGAFSKVGSIEIFKPGDTVLLHYIGVMR